MQKNESDSNKKHWSFKLKAKEKFSERKKRFQHLTNHLRKLLRNAKLFWFISSGSDSSL
jgi:hypothetical protein